MKYPRLDDPDLAYETGLHIGDGCLSHYRMYDYRYVLSGNRTTEGTYYHSCLVQLLNNLYELTPHIYEYRNSIYATIYSKALAKFKSIEIGLPIGPKDKLDCLPERILNQGRRSSAGLVSGLYDADGSLKIRKTSSGDYPRISLAQKAKGIVEDLRWILLEEFHISSTMYCNDYFDRRVGKVERRWFIDINGFRNLRRFIDSIGSRHPVINSRVDLFLDTRNTVYPSAPGPHLPSLSCARPRRHREL